MLNISIWKHLAAFVYDIFPVLGIIIVTSGITLMFRLGSDVSPYTWWFMLIIYLEIALYYIYFWKKSGQTIGMKAWKIKIKPCSPNQSHLTWRQASLRFIVGIVSTLMLGLGVLWKLFSKNNLTWMDMVSQSVTSNIKE
ncbi:MAG: RDD family protein [Proteobacteria bacterium]|nr:RDD family protein [Pseudomonadota bacterium]